MKRVEDLNENEFINSVVIPLLRIMGFNNVKPVPHHRPSEFGQDIRMFSKMDSFGRLIFHGAQVKVVKVHTDSKFVVGNAQQISAQLDLALNSKFIDEADNEEKKLIL